MAERTRPPRRRFPEGTTAEDLKAYMTPFVATLGFKFNTDEEFVGMVLDGELQVLGETGDVFCPCRARTGDPKTDVRIVCPCIRFYLDEFNAMRKCWCGLFVRDDVKDGAALHGVATVPEGPVEVRVASASEFMDGRGKQLSFDGRTTALFRYQDRFYALGGLCKHWGAPLGEGYLDGPHVMCPWHGWRYDVRDGTTDHPGADVRTYEVAVRDGEVYVTLPEATKTRP